MEEEVGNLKLNNTQLEILPKAAYFKTVQWLKLNLYPFSQTWICKPFHINILWYFFSNSKKKGKGFDIVWAKWLFIKSRSILGQDAHGFQNLEHIFDEDFPEIWTCWLNETRSVHQGGAIMGRGWEPWPPWLSRVWANGHTEAHLHSRFQIFLICTPHKYQIYKKYIYF